MASQVLSGTGNVSYTNNTGQNVRVVINYLQMPDSTGVTGIMSWATGVSLSIGQAVRLGRNLATGYLGVGGPGFIALQNLYTPYTGSYTGYPTELMLAPGQTFSVTTTNPAVPVNSYNIVVIPEAG